MGDFNNPSLRPINLLRWPTELRDIFYLLEYWFIIKGYNSGTARWKNCIGQGIWEGAQNLHALSGHTTLPASWNVQQLESSLNPFIWVFVEALLKRHDELNLWPLVIELNLQSISFCWRLCEMRGEGIRLKVPTL